MADTRTAILDLAEDLVQARGYNGFSYRDIADGLGIKTASVHYHFAGKAALGTAVAQRYIDRQLETLRGVADATTTSEDAVQAYLDAYRRLLANGRMCVCLMLAAELMTLPDEVASEATRFARANLDWLTEVLGRDRPTDRALRDAHRLFSAIEGSLILARLLSDSSVFENAVADFV